MAGETAKSSEEAGSLWIDYLLLPSKLEQHLASLAAGTATKPSHLDLILMFLDQALLCYKSAPSNRELEVAIAVSNAAGKPAVLCEHAAKVGVASQLTLADVESIPSQQHQFLLLKTLIKYDKANSLLHQCDLHRWFIHNVLKPQPARITRSSTRSSATSQRASLLGDDLHLISAGETGDIVAGAENDSITFIETVLGCSQAVEDHNQPIIQVSERNISSVGDDFPGMELLSSSILSEVYECQLLMDIGEVHFMRGRIWKAHELFTRCGKKLENAPACNDAHSAQLQVKTLNSCNYIPISRDRLAGFIIACRMAIGMHLLTAQSKRKVELLQGIGMKQPPLLFLDSPSLADHAIIACEQSRWLLRSRAFLLVLPANAFGSVVNPAHCNSFVNLRNPGISEDIGVSSRLLQPDRVFSCLEGFEDLMAKADCLFSLVMESAVANDTDTHCKEDRAKYTSKKEFLASSNTEDLNQGQPLVSSKEIAQKCLVDVFANDLFRGHLTWGYRFSLEKDLSIPPLTRSHVIGCNALRSILVGASLESFLRVSEHLDSSVEAVSSLLKMIVTSLRGEVATIFMCDVNESKPEWLTALHPTKKRRFNEAELINREVLVSRLHQFVKYVCCVIDKFWCWELARDLCLLSDEQIRKLRGSALDKILGDQHRTAGQCTFSRTSDLSGKKDAVAVFKLMQAGKLCDYEALLKEETKPFFSQELAPACTDSMQVEPKQKCLSEEKVSSQCTASVLRQKAFDAVRYGSQYELAKYLYSQSLLFDSENSDCDLMLWLLWKVTKEKGEEHKMNSIKYLQKKQLESFPTLEVVAFALQKLIDVELWDNLQEVCLWLASFADESLLDQVDNYEKLKKRVQILALFGKMAMAVGKLCTFCSSSRASVASKDLGPTMCRLFEDFLCQLFDVGGMSSKDIATPQAQMMIHSSSSTSIGTLPLILNISNPDVLMCLATLTAGWLQRLHTAKLTEWPLDVERYGVLASIMASTPISSTMGPPTTSIHKNFTLRISPDAVRDYFRMLLERITDLPYVVELDMERGHCWLQGLADLAFEDGDHIKSLQYYLQAGAMRTACYCDHTSSMPHDIFTPWIVLRMISACRAMGAGLQGAVLCQCLPVPDCDLAFQILQQSMVIMDQDMELYAECIWEVPILELLIHMHSKAGDESRVSALISVLQQPALNVHNPCSVRRRHIHAMEQRFLQRFYDEIM